MFAINDIADFVRILKEEPEWAASIRGLLLGQEMLDMSTRLEGYIHATEEHNRLVRERLDKQEHNSGILATRVDALTEQMVALTACVETLTARVNALTEQMVALTEQMVALTARVNALTEQVRDLKGQINRLTGQVGNLDGAELERRVSVNIVNFANFQLGLNQVQVLKSAVVHTHSELQTLLLSAVDQKLLTDNEASQIGFSDIVLLASRRDSACSVYVVIEVSRSIADNDIVRAERRAQALARASGLEAMPVIIGARISEKQQTLAENRNVIFLGVKDR